MPQLNQCVKILNDAIISVALPFEVPARIKAYGIAETVRRQGNGREDSPPEYKFPGEVQDNGEAKVIVLDSDYNVMFYHRVESCANANETKPAGRGQGDIIETANMTLTFFAFSEKVKKPVWELEAYVKDAMPDTEYKVSNDKGFTTQSTRFVIGNSSFDKNVILQKEYTQIDMNLINVSVFQMSYRIVSRFRKGCLTASL